MSLSGEWVNELGSRMKLEATDGELAGTYHTQVGNAEGVYALTGAYDMDETAASQSLSFCVVWRNEELNSHSATAWAGQLQRDEYGDVIFTTWLLTRETDRPDDWESTNVGQDIYRRSGQAQTWKPARHPQPHPHGR